MSDALSLLRNFVKNRKEFFEEDDKIVFGDVAYPKNVKTNFLIYGFVLFCLRSLLEYRNLFLISLAIRFTSTGKEDRPKDYYTLECLVYLVKNRDLQHPMYVKTAGVRINQSPSNRPFPFTSTDRSFLFIFDCF